MPRLEELRTALASQTSPLAHVEAAHQEAWGLVYARSVEGTPPGAWQKTRAFLEGSRPLLKRHRETLEQHQIGIDRAAKLEGEQQIGYLAKMGDHFGHRVRELEQFKEDLLDTSAAVGAGDPEAELGRVDTLLTLMSYAAGDLARQAKEYEYGLSSPAAPVQQVDQLEQPDLIGDLIAAPAMAAGAAVGTTMETAGEVADGLVWGEAPAVLGSVDDRVAFYRDNYGVEMRFAADGRPILEPIGDLSLTLPQRGLGLGVEAPSLSHGDQAY